MDKNKEKIIIAAAIVIIALLAYFGFYKCPFRLITGIPCPGCGMTRAFRALFRGDIEAAFYYHPMWPLVVLALILMGLYYLKLIKPSGKMINIAGLIAALGLLICYIVRLATHTLFVI